MSHPALTGIQLSRALSSLGVNFVLGSDGRQTALPKQPVRLLAALAQSNEARLRLSLIALFLQHPEFSAHVHAAAAQVPPPARLTLQCYYSAAVWLGQEQQIILPDLFSDELGLTPTDQPAENLRQLASRQAALSGVKLNWLGTYQHAAQVWLKGLEFQKAAV
jgi:hypothetical protein